MAAEVAGGVDVAGGGGRLFELLTESGFAVAGKDPLATFLTQLSRSPVMHKTTQAGVYELDRDSPGRLREQLSALQTELRAVTENPGPTGDLAEIRQRRESVLSEIVQVKEPLRRRLAYWESRRAPRASLAVPPDVTGTAKPAGIYDKSALTPFTPTTISK